MAAVACGDLMHWLKIIAILLVVAFLVVVLVLWRQRISYLDDEKRIARGLPSIVRGMTEAKVISLLGEPTFVENRVADTYPATNEECRRFARSAFVYQDDLSYFARSRPRDTIVVYFDDAGAVACVERSTKMRVLVR